ncbi:MAG: permease-like cell division protein FtsX [Bacteroidaceae bacterium]|nr:permease-like cell division protein FtsX [Bacteroidaceae bacterium]
MTAQKKKRKIDLLFITSCISTSLVLMLIGLITLLLLTARDISKKFRQEMTVEVILKEEITDAQLSVLKNKIQNSPYCGSLSIITKEEALKEMSEAMGTDPSMFLEYNPFYASINVRLNEGYAVNDSLKNIAQELTSVNGVKEVNWQEELLDTMNDNIRKLAIILTILILVLSLISLTLIRNTIKLTIYSQRFILYSMKLVGAKWSFIRRPFVKRNLLIGLLSAILACLAIYGGLKFGISREPWLSVLLEKRIIITVATVVIATGLLITYLCAMASVNRFLRMKSGELHYL